MPIQKTVNLYRYSELSEDAKARAREWYRDVSAGDNFFAESVDEDARSIAGILGFTIDKHGIAWSGFGSQGDGASFAGAFEKTAGAPEQIREYAPTDETLHAIADDLAALPIDACSIVRTSRQYSHPYTVRADDLPDGTDHATEEQINSAIRAFMQWIYRQLETEYEYSLSDDVVGETIEANEYTFTEDGKRLEL